MARNRQNKNKLKLKWSRYADRFNEKQGIEKLRHNIRNELHVTHANFKDLELRLFLKEAYEIVRTNTDHESLAVAIASAFARKDVIRKLQASSIYFMREKLNSCARAEPRFAQRVIGATIFVIAPLCILDLFYYLFKH